MHPWSDRFSTCKRDTSTRPTALDMSATVWTVSRSRASWPTYNDQYRTKRSVRPLADEVLDPLNQGLQVNGPMTLQQYAETVYFPNIKTKKSPSTVKGYVNLYNAQIQWRIGGRAPHAIGDIARRSRLRVLWCSPSRAPAPRVTLRARCATRDSRARRSGSPR